MISLSGRTPSLTIRQRCSSVTVDACHTRSGGGISGIGEKQSGIRARSRLPKQRKTPNRAVVLEAGKAMVDERRKIKKKLRRRKKPNRWWRRRRGVVREGSFLPTIPIYIFQ